MQELLEPPTRAEQMAFNRKRWAEIVADPALAALPGKVECNAYGNVIMMPPASGDHSYRQGEIVFLLRRSLGGFALPECPVSTLDGVRAADVGWYSEKRFAAVEGQIAFETAPEICVEVLSPANTEREMAAKAGLYFDAGALEVWLCDSEGRLRFLDAEGPLETDVQAIDNSPTDKSEICGEVSEVASSSRKSSTASFNISRASSLVVPKLETS